MWIPDPPDRLTIAAYLRRIGFDGDVALDAATLRELHRRHILAIPYDALDVQLRRPVSVDPRDAFRKIVHGRRGGWCYEMNGLFAWMLTGLGFRVMRMAGTVARAPDDIDGRGDHLVLLVDLETSYVADVGFGEGPREAFPLIEGTFRQVDCTFRLREQDAGWWRLSNETQTDAPTFDFRTVPAKSGRVAATNRWLQTNPDSPFVRTAVVARGVAGGYDLVRGRVITEIRGSVTTTHRIESADEYRDVLRERFGIDLPEAEALWPRIVARHEEVFGAEADHRPLPRT